MPDPGRSLTIVRRDTGEGYEAFLTRLAKASGIATPTREDLARPGSSYAFGPG